MGLTAVLTLYELNNTLMVITIASWFIDERNEGV